MVVCIFEHVQWGWALNDRLVHGDRLLVITGNSSEHRGSTRGYTLWPAGEGEPGAAQAGSRPFSRWICMYSRRVRASPGCRDGCGAGWSPRYWQSRHSPLSLGKLPSRGP